MWIEIDLCIYDEARELSCHVCGMWIEMSSCTLSTIFVIGSCHVCGMWIEILLGLHESRCEESCHVCGMWIEITQTLAHKENEKGHATYVACGLK